MKQSKKPLVFSRALFPFVMTCVALMLFAVVYFYLTSRSIYPRYLENLIFAVPFACFGTIALLTAADRIEASVSAVLTGVLIFVLSAVMLVVLVHRALDESTAVITDTGRYERVLELSGYPADRLIAHFPAHIPEDAENVLFSYNPAFGQGGENFELKFDTDADSITGYIAVFSRASRWQGTPGAEAEKNGIFPGDFSVFGYTALPSDFTIYLLYSKSYRPGDWNHGEVALVAISQERREILFHAEDW